MSGAKVTENLIALFASHATIPIESCTHHLNSTPNIVIIVRYV